MLNLLKKAACYLAMLLLSQSVHAAVIFSNLGDATNGHGVVSATIWHAAKTNVGASATTIDSFVAPLKFTSNSAPLVARVCADNAGVPNLASCSIFTTTDSITGALSNISYTGTFSAPANANVWVVLGTSAAGVYQWATSIANTSPRSASADSGTSWTAGITPELLYSISGAPTPAPVLTPTLSEWALILFTLMLLAVGIRMQRGRRF